MAENTGDDLVIIANFAAWEAAVQAKVDQCAVLNEFQPLKYKVRYDFDTFCSDFVGCGVAEHRKYSLILPIT